MELDQQVGGAALQTALLLSVFAGYCSCRAQVRREWWLIGLPVLLCFLIALMTGSEIAISRCHSIAEIVLICVCLFIFWAFIYGFFLGGSALGYRRELYLDYHSDAQAKLNAKVQAALDSLPD